MVVEEGVGTAVAHHLVEYAAGVPDIAETGPVEEMVLDIGEYQYHLPYYYRNITAHTAVTLKNNVDGGNLQQSAIFS